MADEKTAPLTEEQLTEQQRAIKEEKVKRVTDALNALLQKEKCTLVPELIVQGGQIVAHRVVVAAL
jgi:hypothetical protein